MEKTSEDFQNGRSRKDRVYFMRLLYTHPDIIEILSNVCSSSLRENLPFVLACRTSNKSILYLAAPIFGSLLTHRVRGNSQTNLNMGIPVKQIRVRRFAIRKWRRRGIVGGPHREMRSSDVGRDSFGLYCLESVFGCFLACLTRTLAYLSH